MTDNRDPLHALQSIIEDKEKSTASSSVLVEPNEVVQNNQETIATNPAVSAEQKPATQTPNPEQLATQKEVAEKMAAMQARIQELKQTQAVEDEQAIENIRQELPEISTKEELDNNAIVENQNSSQEAVSQKIHQVEQLERLD
jgi:hypothetical protein